jgi:peptidoglycan/xylan/chitin deacetylase (PgdA/CDA1 family)
MRRLAVTATRQALGTIVRVDTPEPVVAVTFDDGPDPRYLPPLLDLLERHQVRATFFVIGSKARQYPELVERLARAGHAIGNHTFTHVSLPTLNSVQRRKELRACASAIAARDSGLMRPPYGHQSLTSRLDALLCGYDVVVWSVDVWDWLHKAPEWMFLEMRRKTGPGDILLLHDAIDAGGNKELNEDRSQMLAALEMFLEDSRGRFRFVTIPELLRKGRPVRVVWRRQRLARTS